MFQLENVYRCDAKAKYILKEIKISFGTQITQCSSTSKGYRQSASVQFSIGIEFIFIPSTTTWKVT